MPDKGIQTVLQGLKMTARESEIVVEVDIPEKVVADFIRTVPGTKQEAAAPISTPRKPVRKKRTKR